MCADLTPAFKVKIAGIRFLTYRIVLAKLGLVSFFLTECAVWRTLMSMGQLLEVAENRRIRKLAQRTAAQSSNHCQISTGSDVA